MIRFLNVYVCVREEGGWRERGEKYVKHTEGEGGLLETYKSLQGGRRGFKYRYIWAYVLFEWPLTIHHFNIHSLNMEMFKVNSNIVTTIIDDILTRSYHSYITCPKSNSFFPIICKRSNFCRFLWYPYTENDIGLDKRFWNFRPIQKQNPKMEPDWFPLHVTSGKKCIINQIWFLYCWL